MSNPIRPTSFDLRADIPPTTAWTPEGTPFVATSAVWAVWLGRDTWGTVVLFGADKISARVEVEVVDGGIVWPAGLTPPAWFEAAVSFELASALGEEVAA